MRKKLNIGDVIVINKYISPDNVELKQHSFIVVNTEKGKISGIEINLDLELKFDLVATVMSSIKNNEQKDKIKSYYPKNMLVEFTDTEIINGNKQEGFIKVNQLYYFQSDNIKYIKIGKLTKETLNKLLELIEINSDNGDLIANYNNLKVTNRNDTKIE